MKKKILFIILGLLLVTLACNLNQATPTPNGNIVATSVALTIEAGGQAPPTIGLPSPLPSMTPAIPPTMTFTPTVSLSPTPSVPMASVSEDTNCRTGPGKVYDYIGALVVGEKAEVVGKNTASDYWIIKNPDRNGNCWLWGYYATVVGNTDNLQEYAIPPTPTPAPPLAPSNLAVTSSSCIPNFAPNFSLTLNLSWNDNSDNEDVFFVYQDGAQLFGVAVDQNFTGDFTVFVTDSVPSEIAVSASNATGESARAVVQVVCP
ncbi:MAG TPA: hypothetical protein EYP74_02885 [Anaerolineales bacterium]|nr:hypothetical protein [Anaerolineales bacterium]